MVLAALKQEGQEPMSAAPPQIIFASSTVSRLRQLLLVLSSSHPGEVVNSARAIERTLQSVGSDWYDLTARLFGTPQIELLNTGNDDDGDWRVMHKFCLAHQHLLRPREIQFVTNLSYWRGDLTVKQHDWLISIFARVRSS
jgi:hypothetical protein